MKLITSFKNFILDILFPIKCLGCGKEFEDREPKERWVCDDCLSKIIIRKEQVCPVCEKASEGGKTCWYCRKKTGLDGLWVASEYSDKLLAQTIHKFKFNFVRDLSYPLGKIILKSVLEQEEFGDFQDFLFTRSVQNLEEDLENTDSFKSAKSFQTIIVPVPLHRRRFNWRGFNQSELLAKQIVAKSGLKVYNNLLIRWRNTTPQTKIRSMEERKKNIKGAFKVVRMGLKPIPTGLLKNKNIIIVDDVCTTLATLNECALAVKRAGAKNVWGVVVARR
jgi:ComF family protein